MLDRSSQIWRSRSGVRSPRLCGSALVAVFLALLVLLVLGLPGRGHAEDRARATSIAILPLAAQESSTAIYSKLVADALARQVRSELARLGHEVAIEVLSSSSAVPARVNLVIDGRIVARSSGRVLLEAQIRDAENGTRLAVVATRSRRLTDIDRLARDLGRDLARDLARAVTEHERAAAEAVVMPETVIAGARSTGNRSDPAPEAGAAGSSHSARKPADHDRRPVFVVFDAVGMAAQGTVPVDTVATSAGHRLVSGLGFRPVASHQRGIVPAATAVRELRRAGARYGLMLDVLTIDFSWYGVLVARGKVHAVVVDAGGNTVYDRVHDTDTVVGSRGDRHAVLVRFVLAQARTILSPELTVAFARGAAPGARK